MTEKPLMTVDEVSLLTGFSKVTLYKWARTGAIPAQKYGNRSIRFDRRQIEAWMAKRPSAKKPRRRAAA